MVDLVVFPPLSSDGWRAVEDLRAIVGTVDSGAETRVQRDVQYRRTYSIPWDSMDTPTRIQVRDFKRLRGGIVRGFLLIDVFECYYPNQTIGHGDGATTAFQLSFTLADAATSLTRAIRYPIPTGTPLPANVQGYVPGQATAKTLVTVAGASKVEGVDFAVSPSTGVVTFTNAPAAGAAIVATFWAFVPVRFSDSKSSVTFKGTLGSRSDDLVEVLNE